MLLAVIIPTKFFPAALITPPFPFPWPGTFWFVNSKSPESIEVSLVASSRTTSAEKVETPTASSIDVISSNEWSVNLTIVLRELTPLIVKLSNLLNFPVTSDILNVFVLDDIFLTYPTAPLLLPCILSPVDIDVIAVPTRIWVKVFTSNNRSSYWVVASWCLSDSVWKS